MRFTREEYTEKLIPQGKKIEEFVKNEVQPYLTEEIKVSFGEIVERGRYNEIREHQFSIYVSKNELVGTCGGLSILFDMRDDQKGVCGLIDVWDNYGHGGEFLFELCLNWQTIKRKLLNGVEDQKKKRSEVFDNFQV